ncbi:MAG: B12-binding domain-containing protein [Anaerofustis sp.]
MEEKIVAAVSNLNDELTLSLVKESLEQGIPVKTIMKWLNEGMYRIGLMYEADDCYIADLIMAGYIYRQVLMLDEMQFDLNGSDESKIIGTILICTVEGDVHDIGKDIFINLAKTEGYRVIDLGVDVHSQIVFDQVLHIKPDILAMSGIITNSIKYMKETVDLLKTNFLRHEVKILLGGLSMSDEMCNYIGADFATTSAEAGLIKCNEWMKAKYGDQ